MKSQRAFSLIELLVVIAIIGILAAMLLPTLGRSLRQADRVHCLNNLRQIGISFQQFADDHQNRYPMQVAEAEGGARETTERATNRIGFLVLAGGNFVAVERELGTPKLLVCRAERRQAAENFTELNDSHVSYLLATNALPGSSISVLAADRNLEAHRPATDDNGDTNNVLLFGAGTHQRRGNVLLADGRVEWLRGLGVPPVEVFPTGPAGQAPNRPGGGGSPGSPTGGLQSQPPGTPTNPPGQPPVNQPQPSPPGFDRGSPSPTLGTSPAPGSARPETNAIPPTAFLPDQPSAAPAPIALVPIRPVDEPAGRNWWWLLLLLLALAVWRYLRRQQESVEADSAAAVRGAPAGMVLTNAVAASGSLAQTFGVKKFFTGAALNADLLVTMLEKHGINARQEFARPEMREHEDEFSREAVVYVPEAGYDRAYQLFYAERQDEL
jgi:prepilin-type N-terminal cleavage/methylation domain-containing protein/MYXO-CTERM domain-containing protein/prepilin-type processing-associated H-X9-DG protein